MISKILGGALILLVSVIIGSVLALNCIADMIELTMDARVNKQPRDYKASSLKVSNSGTSLWNGEHQALQPAQGYRAVQASEVPLQRTARGQ